MFLSNVNISSPKYPEVMSQKINSDFNFADSRFISSGILFGIVGILFGIIIGYLIRSCDKYSPVIEDANTNSRDIDSQTEISFSNEGNKKYNRRPIIKNPRLNSITEETALIESHL